MNVIVTGITGFAGSHLADLLVREGHNVVGTHRWRSPTENIAHLHGKIILMECDVRDASSVRNLVAKVEPEIIFHLAAQSYVPASWHAPEETITTNVLGTLHVLNAVREVCPRCVVHIAGSSEEYGLVEGTPIFEAAPLRPLSPYAVSKVTQDLLGYQYQKSYGLNIVRTRAFNHSGARRSPMFALSGFVKAFVEVFKRKVGDTGAFALVLNKDGTFPIAIRHGNLEAVRDFVHVLDVVRAYYGLAMRAVGKPNAEDMAINICTGKGYHIYEALGVIELYAREHLGLRQHEDYVYVPDQIRMRPSDVPVLVGANNYLSYVLRWKPEKTLLDIVADLFAYWIEKI